MDTAELITDNITELLRKIEAKLQYLEHLINESLARMPAVWAAIADRVRDVWSVMHAKIEEFWGWFVDKLTYVGNPFVLNGAANGWTQMGGKIAQINDTITDEALSVDDDWSGHAADQYIESIGPQRNANTSILEDYAKNIASAMTALAIAIAAMWASVVAALIALIIQIMAAVAAAATGVGAPAAPGLVINGILQFLGIAGAGVLILYVTAGAQRPTLSSASGGIPSWPRMASW